jgi:selenocysteine-specific elongation factor
VDRVGDDEAFDGFLVQRPEGFTFTEMARLLNVDLAHLMDLASQRRKAGTAVLAVDGARLVARATLDRFGETIRETLAAFHTTNPLQPAMAVSEIRGRVEPRCHQALETALRELQDTGAVVVEGGSARLANHAVAFDAGREQTRQRLLALYEQARLQPPSKDAAVAQLSGEGLPDVAGVIESLVRTGDLVGLSHELMVHARVLDEAKARILPFLQAPEGVTVGQAREILDTTRKYAVPLFELLDRQGFTVRRGDVRILSPSGSVPRHDAV